MPHSIVNSDALIHILFTLNLITASRSLRKSHTNRLQLIWYSLARAVVKDLNSSNVSHVLKSLQ